MKALHELSAAEADRLIIEHRRSLVGHAQRVADGQDDGSRRAAMDTSLSQLSELAELHPGKWAKIGALLERYRAPAGS